MKRILGLFLVLTMVSANAATWEIDTAHSTAKFKVKHLMVTNVHGSFREIKGTVNIDDKDATKIATDVKVNPNTVNTDNTDRDKHLRNADFFDTAKFKEITFKSKKSEKQGDKLTLTGDLTMHGVTKEVTFVVDEMTAPVKGFDGNPKRGLSASTKINRSDWGLKWNKAIEAGGVAVSEQVDIVVELELNGPKETKKS